MFAEINWYRAFFFLSEGLNWFIAGYIFCLWKWLPTSLKILGAYLAIIPLFVALNYSVWYFFEFNTRFLFHLLVPIEFVFFSLFFRQVIQTERIKRWLTWSNFLFVAFCVFLIALRVESFWKSSPDITETVMNIFVIVCSLVVFYEIYSSAAIVKLEKHPVFIVVISIFFFSSTTLILNATQNFCGYDLHLADIYYFFTCLFWIIKSMALFYALWLIYKEYSPPTKTTINSTSEQANESFLN
jgi:hypothetical protein